MENKSDDRAYCSPDYNRYMGNDIHINKNPAG